MAAGQRVSASPHAPRGPVPRDQPCASLTAAQSAPPSWAWTAPSQCLGYARRSVWRVFGTSSDSVGSSPPPRARRRRCRPSGKRRDDEREIVARIFVHTVWKDEWDQHVGRNETQPTTQRHAEGLDWQLEKQVDEPLVAKQHPEQQWQRRMPAGEYTAVLLPKLRCALRAFLLSDLSGQEECNEADANVDRGCSARRTLEALADTEASTQTLQEHGHAMDVAEDEPGCNSEPVVSIESIATQRSRPYAGLSQQARLLGRAGGGGRRQGLRHARCHELPRRWSIVPAAKPVDALAKELSAQGSCLGLNYVGMTREVGYSTPPTRPSSRAACTSRSSAARPRGDTGVSKQAMHPGGPLERGGRLEVQRVQQDAGPDEAEGKALLETAEKLTKLEEKERAEFAAPMEHTDEVKKLSRAVRKTGGRMRGPRDSQVPTSSPGSVRGWRRSPWRQ